MINVLQGEFWKEFLSHHLPCLCEFDLFVSVLYSVRGRIHLDHIINSFEYFLIRFKDWNIIVSRWYCTPLKRSELKFD
jgi:hypothetical protein